MPVIHIITPSGVRFENRWPDKRCPLCRRTYQETETNCPGVMCDNEALIAAQTPDKEILDALSQIKKTFGYNQTVEKRDKLTGLAGVAHALESSGFVFDNPNTVVAVVDTIGRIVRCLKGSDPSKVNTDVPLAKETVPPSA